MKRPKPLSTLKRIREEKGITQQQIADAVGISSPQYCYLESGKRRLTLEMATKIANYLGISVETISQDFFNASSITKRQHYNNINNNTSSKQDTSA